jgi:Tfp pilus assembly protein PilO
MTGRDRLVVVGLSALAVLAAVWLLMVSPERQKAAKLQTQVNAANAQLTGAEGQVANARAAQATYAADYATLVKLGKAVPAAQEVPSLIYELAQASNQKSVDFTSILSGSSGSASPSTTASTSASAAAVSGLTPVPFTFTFTGSFSGLYHLFSQLNDFATRTASGGLQVNGRLLTIQSVKLAPVTTSTTAPSSGAKSSQLTGIITATAYELPAVQGLTPGASAGSQSAIPTSASTSPVSSTSASGSSPAAPAIVKANP